MLNKNPKIVIIILNWNSWKDTIECLKSLFQIIYNNYDLILIDNGSDDDSIERIGEYLATNNSINFIHLNYNESFFIEHNNIEFDSEYEQEKKVLNFESYNKVILIRNKFNYGFTKGNNIGINYAIKNLSPKYILLLNNDTVVDREFLSELVRVGEGNENAGFLGPKIYFYDFKGKKDIIQYAGSSKKIFLFQIENRGIFEMDEGQYDQIEEVTFIHGSCLLARVDMIKVIGMLDEDFFSYREENDWCIRGYNNGWKSVYVPNSKIWHKGGKSSGGYLSSLTIFYKTRNDFLLLKKHGKLFQKIMFFMYFFFIKSWILSGIYLVYHKNYRAFISFLSGFKEGVFWKKKK